MSSFIGEMSSNALIESLVGESDEGSLTVSCSKSLRRDFLSLTQTLLNCLESEVLDVARSKFYTCSTLYLLRNC